ncbi:MAG TPA: flagellar hook-associated protein FlgL [Novimethylophilus sp.]|jgi:flagellar hook-associated protein 3 FlgL|uniref:flagellar hook-associated protein FlgL n=1 Tax=Novimethylophilus sp. TaxID=2137426 RepID=UPI002F425E02
MRISTSMLYDQGTVSVQNQYADLLKIQQQMSTGRRILAPSDDPIAAAHSLDVGQSQAANEQFIRNSNNATSALQLQDSVLSDTGELLHRIRELTVNAGNPTLSAANRSSLASELQTNYDQLLAMANTNDGNGQYLFSGYKGGTQPFSETSPGTVVYNGDQGQRLIQISSSRQVPVSNSGADIFQLIHNGNGTFVTAAAAANTGTGVVSPGNVLDPAAWNSASNNKNLTVKFYVNSGVTPSVTTYDIVDNVSGNSLLTGVAAAAGPYPRTYTSGNTISLKSQGAEPAFDLGAELSVSGDPATGDTFSVKASTNQDIFTTLYSLITSLKSNGNNAAITNANNTALSNIDQAQDKLFTVRAAVGSAMKEVEAQRNTNDDLAVQYKSTLSNLQDLDYTKAISDLTQKQVALEAAQKSFLKIQGLSLFNFIS